MDRVVDGAGEEKKHRQMYLKGREVEEEEDGPMLQGIAVMPVEAEAQKSQSQNGKGFE